MGMVFAFISRRTLTVAAALALGMERSLVRYQGGGHRAYAVLGNTCIDRIGDAYLFDLAVPAEGFSCPARPVSFTPPATAVGADGKRTPDADSRPQLRGQSPRRP